MSKGFDKCDIHCINHEAVNRVRAGILDDSLFMEMAGIFKALGDPNRVKIVQCLSQEELCVCDVASLTGMSVSAVSHQLRVLRDKRLVKHRREGKIVYYSLDDQHIVDMFGQCLQHVEHE